MIAPFPLKRVRTSKSANDMVHESILVLCTRVVHERIVTRGKDRIGCSGTRR